VGERGNDVPPRIDDAQGLGVEPIHARARTDVGEDRGQPPVHRRQVADLGGVEALGGLHRLEQRRHRGLQPEGRVSELGPRVAIERLDPRDQSLQEPPDTADLGRERLAAEGTDQSMQFAQLQHAAASLCMPRTSGRVRRTGELPRGALQMMQSRLLRQPSGRNAPGRRG